ncbi:MAG TPA: YggS family pyridoxal phosphate-dependent enzyme [Flavisolibacter sp.]|nr:YggS family pyridoxal phosphate-dependent enzyme [Flavisolibacter sp.]
MSIQKENYSRVLAEAKAANATLVAVSKTKPVEDLQALYDLGHRDFGENYVQELVDKQGQLPADIRWHFIGHLQSNKVKYIAPFVHLIHGIDSLKLLKEVNKQAEKFNRTIDVLLQVHIAQEETKFGLDEGELDAIFTTEASGFHQLNHIAVKGLMGMASFSDDKTIVQQEFQKLKMLLDKYAKLQTPNAQFQTLSMGMSGDYTLALQEGSNMIRVGSLIFGSR